MSNDDIQDRVDAPEAKLAFAKNACARRGVRKRAETHLCGLPLYEIAIGPDPAKGEVRGHARGIIAIGDLATGVVALGGVARGFVAIGGLALGAVSLGGCSIGMLLAVGGVAIGILALGGAAVGIVAIGGAAFGYYACGGAAGGAHVLSALQQDEQPDEIED